MISIVISNANKFAKEDNDKYVKVDFSAWHALECAGGCVIAAAITSGALIGAQRLLPHYAGPTLCVHSFISQNVPFLLDSAIPLIIIFTIISSDITSAICNIVHREHDRRFIAAER